MIHWEFIDQVEDKLGVYRLTGSVRNWECTG